MDTFLFDSFKIRRVVKKLLQILTDGKTVDSKFDTWHAIKVSRQNLMSCKNFCSKSDTFTISWFKAWRFSEKVNSKTNCLSEILIRKKIFSLHYFFSQNQTFQKKDRFVNFDVVDVWKDQKTFICEWVLQQFLIF